MLKQLKLLLLLIIFFCFFPSPILASDDFKIIYTVNYFVNGANNNLKTDVDFQIKVVNLRSDIYIKKFSLAFPKSFSVKNLVVTDDKGPVTTSAQTDDLKTKIDMEFNQPEIGKASQNNFYLKYTQDNLFKNTGNIWEMILPVIENKEGADYKISVTLPEESSKKLTLAKPKPTSISGRQIFWENPQTKTIYGIFGDKQLYEAQLTYNLKNPNYTFVYTDIALPPDTAYQKIYLNSLNPEPKEVFLDEDGNYLARYVLKPSESKKVILDEVIELSINSRFEARNYLSSLISSQEKYLLNQNKYWKITSLDKISQIKGIADAYKYAVNNLSYNYAKIDEKNNRLGAEKTLASPDQAVCMEFSDLTVAMAREKGIYAREIQGYAFSQESELRPISLTGDVLHSWVEYYDKNQKLWIPIDPTWENTSGIDYYNSLDLNHLVFAIHAKQDDYPAPAGMYKIDNSKDIIIQPTDNQPIEKIKINLDPIEFAKSINDKNSYKTKLTLYNVSNVFLYAVPIEVRADKLNINYQNTLAVIAPFQKKEVEISYQSRVKNIQTKDKLQIFIQGNQVAEQEIKIVPYVYDIALKVIGVVAGIMILYLVIRVLRNSKS